MLDTPTRPTHAQSLMTLPEADAEAAGNPAMATLLGWVRSYLMREHPDLGRTGAVCPFTKRAGTLDTARLAICEAGPGDEETAFALIRRGFAELEAIPCKPGLEHFRTVIVGFPACAGDAEGIAMLQRVQARHKFYSLSRMRMIGFMHATNEAPGLWNPDFRPLRAPLPVLAIRYMVEQDAPFAARHPLLAVPYLIKFRFAGARRLWSAWRSSGG